MKPFANRTVLQGVEVMKLFNLDSPLMRFLSRMTDILWLNILTMVMFLPAIVVGYPMFMSTGEFSLSPQGTLLYFLILLVAAIPVGPALTALHFVCLKLVRGEEGYITRQFFKSFKSNFRQGAIISTVYLIIVYFFWWDFFLINSFQGVMRTLVLGGVTLASILFVFAFTFTYPVLARFKNTIKGTVKNAFLMSVLVLPKTVLMILIMLIPPAACLIYQIIPLALLFFFGAPAYFSAMLYSKTFKRFEPETEDPVGDYEWTVATDETEEAADPEKPADSESTDSKANRDAISEDGDDGR